MTDGNWLYNLNLYERPCCVLQADGIGFEPEVFLQQTIFEPKTILFHGKLGFPLGLLRKVENTKTGTVSLSETTFLLLMVSEAETNVIQLEEARRFWERYGDEIRRLRNFPQVENIHLKFSPNNGEPSESVVDEFMELTGDCGVDGIFI